MENILNGFNIALSHNEFLDYAKVNSDVIYIKDKLTVYSDTIGCSLDPVLGLFCMATVTFCALQLALFCKPKNIYLLGFDMTFAGKVHATSYADESKMGSPNFLYESEVQPAFELASKAAKERNINLVNLSPVSILPETIIPKQKFEDIFK